MKILRFFLTSISFSCFTISSTAQNKSVATTHTIPAAYDSIYKDVQRTTFQYFWEGAEPNSGMGRERIHLDGNYPENDQNIVTTGGSGFGVMAILVGIDRGFITRRQGFERLQKI